MLRFKSICFTQYIFFYADTKSCNKAKRKGAEGVEGLVKSLAHCKWNSVEEIC